MKKMRKKRNKKVAKTSNLLYPITVLEAERDSTFIFPKGQVEQLNKAIDILSEEKHKDEQRKEMVGFTVNKKYKNIKKKI